MDVENGQCVEQHIVILPTPEVHQGHTADGQIAVAVRNGRADDAYPLAEATAVTIRAGRPSLQLTGSSEVADQPDQG